MPVKVPDGCLLVQAGKQLEWFSGGLVKGTSAVPSAVPESRQWTDDLLNLSAAIAGYHEVVCTEGTLKVCGSNRATSYVGSCLCQCVQAMERISKETPERPLIRISSTFVCSCQTGLRVVTDNGGYFPASSSTTFPRTSNSTPCLP